MALRSTQALTACNSRRSKLPLLQVGLNAASLTALQQFEGRAERLFTGVGVQRRSALVDQRTVQFTQAAMPQTRVFCCENALSAPIPL